MAGPGTPDRRGDVQIVAPGTSEALGRRLGAALGIAVPPIELQRFPDGEVRAGVPAQLAGADVYLVHSLNGAAGRSVHDRLFEVVLLLGAARDAGAARLTLVAPYLPYSRHDRRFAEGGTVGTRDVARVLEAAGLDRVATVDVHNLAAFQNAFRCRTVHLESTEVLARHLTAGVVTRPLTVLAPDVGAAKRAEALHDALQRLLDDDVHQVVAVKRRVDHVVEDAPDVHEVAGTDVVIVDDMLSTGGTAARAARAARDQGAETITVAATHGLFVGDAGPTLAATADRVVVTDSVQPPQVPATDPPVEVLDLSPLLADAIGRMAVA